MGRLAAPAGHDYELWSLADGASRPVALGLLRDGTAMVKAGRIGTGKGKLLVSLERAGGSSTGLPGGPVVWASAGE